MKIKAASKSIILIAILCASITGCNVNADKSINVQTVGNAVLTSNLLFPTMVPDRIILNLTNDPIHSVAVNWRTDIAVTQSTVQVATATHGPEFLKEVRDIKGSRELLTHKPENDPEVSAAYHSAIIDGLEPGEQYVYRVGSGEFWSEWYQIKMPKPENKLSFVYFGDAQTNVKSMWARVIRQSYASIPEVDFMLHAGDLINRHDRDIEWGEWFYAGSFIHAMVPSVMTPGNHEYNNVVLSPQWKKQFNLPANGPKGIVELEETCYQVNYPNLKIISLDGEQIDESEEFRTAQRVWVDSILTHDPRKWTAITFHYPMFSTKPNRDNIKLREEFKPIFDKHKVDIVLQGHDHAYGRGFVKNEIQGTNVKDQTYGTVYVVSVSGPKQYEVSDDPWMDRRAANTQLFQIISIEGEKLIYGAYTATGELYDAFDLLKSAGNPNRMINKIPEIAERTEIDK